MACSWIRWSTRAAAAVSMLVAPQLVEAQTRLATLVGIVRDSSGQPVSGVEVWLKGSDMLVRTTDSGGFRLQNLPFGPGSVMVRRLGFAPATVRVTLRPERMDSLVLSLTTMPATLPGVLVEEAYNARSRRILAGFWERRSRGFGHYITRDEIEARDPHDFTDIVRMTPSVSITTRNGRPEIRFGRGGSTRGDCPPQYWVDGQRIEGGRPDEFSAQDVEAVELYSGAATIPAMFAPRMTSRTCGAIVIWTRIPGT